LKIEKMAAKCAHRPFYTFPLSLKYLHCICICDGIPLLLFKLKMTTILKEMRIAQLGF
jgi:hypothetical protein